MANVCKAHGREELLLPRDATGKVITTLETGKLEVWVLGQADGLNPLKMDSAKVIVLCGKSYAYPARRLMPGEQEITKYDINVIGQFLAM